MTDSEKLELLLVEMKATRTDMNRNNNFLLTEMERLHEIALDKIDVVAQEVAQLKVNRNTEDFLIHQVVDLKCRVEKIESMIA